MNKELKIFYDPTLKEVKTILTKHFYEYRSTLDLKKFVFKKELILFRIDGQEIGFLAYSSENSRILNIENMFIVEEFRSKGFGIKIIEQITDIFLKKGIYIFTLSSVDERSTKFWKKCEFIQKDNMNKDPKLFYKLLIQPLNENITEPYSEQIIIKGQDKNYRFNFTVDPISKKFKKPIIINEFEDCEIIWTKNEFFEKSILKHLPHKDLIFTDISIIETSIFN